MFNKSNQRFNKPGSSSYVAIHLFKKPKSPNKEKFNNKENQNNPKQVFKSTLKDLDPVKEISRFGAKENRSEFFPKKNLLKGNFFDDNKQYLSQGIDDIHFNLNLEESHSDKVYSSLKSGYSSINNINSNYFSRK